MDWFAIDVAALEREYGGPGLLLRLLAMERARRGLTARAIAERMGVHPEQVSRLEGGRHDIRLGTLFRYARACNFDERLLSRCFLMVQLSEARRGEIDNLAINIAN